jgi:hypothetical protein
MIESAQIQCPCCWETIELDLDLSAGSATYTEDCPVCCRPMKVRLRMDEELGYTVEVEAES